MKSWKEEKLHKSSQGTKALREYTSSEDFEAVYKYAYRIFTGAVNDIYNKFCNSVDGECDFDTVEHAIQMAVTDAFDDFLNSEA